MALKPEQLRVGGYYVNKQELFVREIVYEAKGQVWWRDYGLSDGQPIGYLVCSRKHLARWAAREATAEEVARLQKHPWQPIEQVEAERAAIASMMEMALRGVSDAALLAEVRRRGLRREE